MNSKLSVWLEDFICSGEKTCFRQQGEQAPCFQQQRYTEQRAHQMKKKLDLVTTSEQYTYCKDIAKKIDKILLYLHQWRRTWRFCHWLTVTEAVIRNNLAAWWMQ